MSEPANDQDGNEATRVQATPAALSDFLTVDEAAVLLRVSRNTLYEVIRSGEAPWARTIGRVVRISRIGLLKWFEQGAPAPRRRRA